MTRKRKRILIIAGIALVAVLIIVGNVGRSSEKGVEVKTSEVSVGSITSTVRAPGKIRPEKEVQISASVPGEIVHLAVREGDRVEKGRLLLQLDKAEYSAQVEQRRATLNSARAGHRLAAASLEQMKSIYQRKQALFERKLASLEELEAARTQLDVQEAELEAASQRIAEAGAALNMAEDNLRKTTFLAPQSGVVSELNVEEGEIVVVGTMNVPGTVIMTVADLAHMQVECDVDETDVVSVKEGQKANIFVDAFPDTVFEATVTEIGSSGKRSASATEGSATDFEVKLKLRPGIERLKPGMTADAEIETATHIDALKVPIQAIVVREKKTLEKWMSKREEKEKKEKKGKRTKKHEEEKVEEGKAEDVALGEKQDIEPVTEIEPGSEQEQATETELRPESEQGREMEAEAEPEPEVERESGEEKEAPEPQEEAVSAGADSAEASEEEVGEEITGVFVVDGDNAKFVPVKTGIMSETDIEILEGLSKEDRVITGPFRVLRELKDGQRIKEEKKEKEKKEEGEESDEED